MNLMCWQLLRLLRKRGVTVFLFADAFWIVTIPVSVFRRKLFFRRERIIGQRVWSERVTCSALRWDNSRIGTTRFDNLLDAKIQGFVCDVRLIKRRHRSGVVASGVKTKVLQYYVNKAFTVKSNAALFISRLHTC